MAYVKWLENGYLRKQAQKYAWFLFILSVLGYLFIRSRFFHNFPPLLLIATGVAIMIAYVRVYVKYSKKILNYDRGFAGEKSVAKTLCELPDSHFGFHDIKLPGMYENIDFVVVTPPLESPPKIHDSHHCPVAQSAVQQPRRHAAAWPRPPCLPRHERRRCRAFARHDESCHRF